MLAFSHETAYSRPFCGVFGAHFPRMTSPIIPTPRGPSLDGNTSFEPQHKNQSNDSTWARNREETGQCKKVTKVFYYLYFKGSPRWTDWIRTLYGGWCLQRNDVCPVSNWYFLGLGYTFTGDRIFYFAINICMGHTTVPYANVLHVIE